MSAEPQPATSRCEFQDQRIRQLEHKLFGNGREGVATRVDRLETKVDTVIRLVRWQIATFLAAAAIVVASGYIPL
jgi:hypothetical protein